MNEMTFNAGTTIQEAKKKGRLVIAFSHAVSELLVVKSVRAYADLRARDVGNIKPPVVCRAAHRQRGICVGLSHADRGKRSR